MPSLALFLLSGVLVASAFGGASAPSVSVEGQELYTYVDDGLSGAMFSLRNNGDASIWLPQGDSFVIKNSDAVVYEGTGLFVISELAPGESVTGWWNFTRGCYHFAGSNPCNGPAPPGPYSIEWSYFPNGNWNELAIAVLEFEIELI